MDKFKVAVVVGSNRRESTNRALAQALRRLGAGQFDVTFVRIDDLPMYSQDLENPFPESVTRMKGEIAAADAVLFVTPEHNRSIPAVLKNAIDWGARPYNDSVWRGKPGAIIGSSPGPIGSAIAQQHLRAVLGDLGVTLIGGEAYITRKPNLVAADDSITDEKVRGFLQAFVDNFAVLVGTLAPVRQAAAA